MPEKNNPAASGKVDGFLSAEAAARELASKLKALEEARSGYAAAKTELQKGFGDAQAQLASAAGRLETLATAVSEANKSVAEGLQVIKTVGGPEILEELRAVRAEALVSLPALTESVQSLKRAVEETGRAAVAARSASDAQLGQIAKTSSLALYLSLATLVGVACTAVLLLVRSSKAP
jgi:chromosome segregation ATPase